MRVLAGPILLLAVLMTAVLGTGASSACGCGEFKGFVVARGESLYGVPWRIEASHPHTDASGRRGVEFAFEFDPPASPESGYFKGMNLPISKRLVFSANAGSEVDPYPEGDVSGVTGSRAATLRVAMSDGGELLIEPQLASPRLRERFPWLRRLRFFDYFFAAGPQPVRITAFDSTGSVLAASSSRRGSFFALIPASSAGDSR